MCFQKHLLQSNGYKILRDKNGKVKTGGMDNTFVIAQWPEPLWRIFYRILSGKVDKGEKHKKDFKPPQKVTHFKELTGNLTVKEKMKLLQSVVNGERTMAEMAQEAGFLRRTKKVQRFIMYDMNEDNWDTCKADHPMICKEDEVQLWLKTSQHFRKNPYKRPHGWEDFLDRARSAGGGVGIELSTSSSRNFTFDGLKYGFHHGDVANLYKLLRKMRGNYG